MKRENLYARSSLEYDGFDKYIESLGGQPKALMYRAGLQDSPFQSKLHFISWAGLVNYFELAARELDEPYLGLKWAFGIPKDYRNSGPTIFLGSIASDMRHFLEMAVRYQKIHTNGVAYSYSEDEAQNELLGYIDIHPLSPPCRQFCEHIMASIAVMGRRYVSNFSLKRVTFQYSEPDDLTWYLKAFECPVHFNAPRNMMVTDSSVLGMRKELLTLKIIRPFLKVYLNWQIENLPRHKSSLSLTIAEMLPGLVGVNYTDINTVSDILEMHPKKVQRLLKDEGTSFSQILDNVRRSLAQRLLIETDISITRLAKMLDYSSDRPFTIASRRWFGMTPSDYRKANR